jgi:hypothetical protein
MAVLKIIPPGPIWPHRSERSYYPSTIIDRTVLRNRRARHAPARPWLSLPSFDPPHQHPADSNRRFKAHVSQNWSDLLSAANRLAWSNLAATITIKNFEGTLITPTGFELYGHFERAWYTWWFSIGAVFNPAAYTPDLNPPSPWSPPATPSNITVDTWSYNGFYFYFDTTPGMDWPMLDLQIANYPPKPGRIFPGQFARLNSWAYEVNGTPGKYRGFTNTQGVCSYPMPHGTYQVRVMVVGDNWPQAPSLWAPATITI